MYLPLLEEARLRPESRSTSAPRKSSSTAARIGEKFELYRAGLSRPRSRRSKWDDTPRAGSIHTNRGDA